MAVLHIVNKSPYERNAFDSCLRLAGSGAGILLIEDGVYAAQASGAHAANLDTALDKHSVYALQADVEARGMGDRLNPGVKLVDYDGFVSLTTEFDKVQSWL